MAFSPPLWMRADPDDLATKIGPVFGSIVCNFKLVNVGSWTQSGHAYAGPRYS
jgi:hypothetical protein